MSVRLNNLVILASITLCLILTLTIWFAENYRPQSIIFGYYWACLLICWFLSILYGPFARVTSWILDEEDPRSERLVEKTWLFIAVMEAIGARVAKD
ncbi:hypothetical protein [Roseibium sp.]|uniref:hypothetical protein n=1 Tax=Roseibium sp. TaxID=1936156 RepID=UPI003B510C77